MSELAVEPSALDTFANMLGSTKSGSPSEALPFQYLTDYKAYVDEHVALSGGGFIFALISDKITAINNQLNLDADSIAANLSKSAAGLNASADDYRKTDAAQAEKMDRVFTPGAHVAIEDGKAGTPFANPRAKLIEPEDEGAVPELAQELLDAGGVFSESDLVIKILRWAGLDIIGWAGDKLAGDHKALARCKNALEALGEFDTSAGDDVANGAATMLGSWKGNAATAATTTFAKTSSGLRTHGAAVSDVTSKMTALLAGMQEGMAALEGALTTALDRAIEAAAAVAAAGCLQAVPGIDVLADLIGAGEVLRVIKACKEFFDIWNVVWAAHEGIVGLIAGLAGGLAGWDASSELPTVSYYNGSQGGPPTPVVDNPLVPGPH